VIKVLFLGDVVAGHFRFHEEGAVFAEGATDGCLGVGFLGDGGRLLAVDMEDVVLLVA
jgi:hypothetical protein